MTIDALDPGPNGDYPYLPRNADGTLNTTLMPVGMRKQRTPSGAVVSIDITPTVADGRRVTDIVPVQTPTD